jgi:hypothetical protein
MNGLLVVVKGGGGLGCIFKRRISVLLSLSANACASLQTPTHDTPLNTLVSGIAVGGDMSGPQNEG